MQPVRETFGTPAFNATGLYPPHLQTWVRFMNQIELCCYRPHFERLKQYAATRKDEVFQMFVIYHPPAEHKAIHRMPKMPKQPEYPPLDNRTWFDAKQTVIDITEESGYLAQYADAMVNANSIGKPPLVATQDDLPQDLYDEIQALAWRYYEAQEFL